MNEAEKMWSDARAFAKAFFDHPAVKAYYKEEARKRSEELKREAEEARRKREASEAERQRSRSYDVWALSGGADECTQFGIRDGCKPECPVFQRGECAIQDENAALFGEDTP